MAGKPVLQAPIAPFRSASDAGWGGEGHGAHAQDADKEPATRPQRTAASKTSFSAVSRASSLVSQKGITSRARTVSSRAGTGHVLERERIEVVILGARIKDEFMQTCNLNRGDLKQWLGLGKAHAHCVVKVTDEAWGVRSNKTHSALASQNVEWTNPPYFDFVRMPGMVKPMLLNLDLIVRERKNLMKSSVVTSMGSVCVDLQDDDVGHDDEPRWHYLLTAEGLNSECLVLMHITKGVVGIEELMAARRRLYYKYTFYTLVLAAALAVLLIVLLAPRFCNAKCRGEWRAEASMSVARADLAAAVYKDHMFAVGGRGLKLVESWNAKDRKWKSEVSMAETRGRLGAAAQGSILVAVGGVGRLTAEAFNGSAFEPYQLLPGIQGDLSAVNFRNDSVCLVGRGGGSGIVPPSLGADASYSLNVFCMKGINTSWVLQTSVPSDRQKFTVANLDGRILVIGGWLHGPSSVVEAYDGNTWQRLPDMLTPRMSAAAAQMANRLYVSGGSDGYSTLGSLESFDGKKWRAELSLISARQQHAALVFDGRLWVLGGVYEGTTTKELDSVESFVMKTEDEFIRAI